MSYPPSYGSPRATRRTAAAGQNSRAAAVRAATEFFSIRGYHQTTIAEVADKAGLSQSGLLHHFPSKAALLGAVLDERDTEDSAFLAADEPAPMGWAAFEALGALVARNSIRRELIGLFVRLSAEAIDTRHPAHTWLRDRYASMRNWLVDAVHAGQESGEISADAPVEAIVRDTIAVMDGLQQQWLLEPDSMSMIQGFSVFVAAIRSQWGSGNSEV